MNTEIILIAMTGVAWLVTLTSLFTKMHSRLGNLESSCNSCHDARKLVESAVTEELKKISRTLGEVKTDVKWLKREQNGGLE